MSGQPGTSAVRRWGELRPTPATRRPLIHSPTTSRPRDPHAVAETAPAMFAHTLTRCVPRLRPPPHRVRDPHAVAEPRAAPGLRTRPRASWCAAPPGDHDRLDRQSYRAELHQNCAKGGCTFRSRYLLSRQRNRTIRTVQVAEQFSGVPSAATPLRAGSTAKWSRLQTKISRKALVRNAGTGHTQWIGNDKSASHRLGHLLGWIQVWKGVSVEVPTPPSFRVRYPGGISRRTWAPHLRFALLLPCRRRTPGHKNGNATNQDLTASEPFHRAPAVRVGMAW